MPSEKICYFRLLALNRIYVQITAFECNFVNIYCGNVVLISLLLIAVVKALENNLWWPNYNEITKIIKNLRYIIITSWERECLWSLRMRFFAQIQEPGPRYVTWAIGWMVLIWIC